LPNIQTKVEIIQEYIDKEQTRREAVEKLVEFICKPPNTRVKPRITRVMSGSGIQVKANFLLGDSRRRSDNLKEKSLAQLDKITNFLTDTNVEYEMSPYDYKERRRRRKGITLKFFMSYELLDAVEELVL